jgi:hypothetical protein
MRARNNWKRLAAKASARSKLHGLDFELWNFYHFRKGRNGQSNERHSICRFDFCFTLRVTGFFGEHRNFKAEVR